MKQSESCISFSCFQFLCEQRPQYIVSVFFISRAFILKILFSSPPGSRVCCRRLVPDSCSIAKRPDVRTYPDLMMEGTRSQHPTSVDSLPLCHHETETVALLEVPKLAVFCDFPSLFPSPPGGTSVAMPQPNLKYTCSASLRIFLNSRAHKLQKCVKLQFRRNAEVRCFAQPVSVEASHSLRSRARPLQCPCQF